jgi:hypothetical protein
MIVGRRFIAGLRAIKELLSPGGTTEDTGESAYRSVVAAATTHVFAPLSPR